MTSETTYSDRDPIIEPLARRAIRSGPVSAIRRAGRRILKAMLRAHLERQTTRELRNLPPYLLRDIGMRQEDIREVASDLARQQADAWARQAQRANGFGG